MSLFSNKSPKSSISQYNSQNATSSDWVILLEASTVHWSVA